MALPHCTSYIHENFYYNLYILLNSALYILEHNFDTAFLMHLAHKYMIYSGMDILNILIPLHPLFYCTSDCKQNILLYYHKLNSRQHILSIYHIHLKSIQHGMLNMLKRIPSIENKEICIEDIFQCVFHQLFHDRIHLNMIYKMLD